MIKQLPLIIDWRGIDCVDIWDWLGIYGKFTTGWINWICRICVIDLFSWRVDEYGVITYWMHCDGIMIAAVPLWTIRLLPKWVMLTTWLKTVQFEKCLMSTEVNSSKNWSLSMTFYNSSDGLSVFELLSMDKKLLIIKLNTERDTN